MILRRLQGSRFSEVVPAWSGATVVLIGGGPSLTLEDVARVEAAHAGGDVRCIAVNDAYLLAPWAEVVHFADVHWWRWQTEGVAKPTIGLTAADVRARWAGFSGQKSSIEYQGGALADQTVHLLRNHVPETMGLSRDPRVLVNGRNSGFQALNLAVLAGAKRVLLLGYDAKPNDRGRAHFLDEHSRATPQAAYPLYRQAMSAAENALLELGVEVLNCSPGSAIDSFPKMALECAL